MAKIEPFEKYSKEYEKWFSKHKEIYQAEIDLVKKFISKDKKGVEIGVGTGRFAQPLGIKIGVEPSKKMAELAEKKGIKVYNSEAEKLPFKKETFDFALMVTTICFVDDVLKSFKEINRILKKNGYIVTGFIDKKSSFGKKYIKKSKQSKFYKYATFYSTDEVLKFLKKTGYKNFIIKQTVFTDQKYKINKIEEGYGKASFVVIKATKN